MTPSGCSLTTHFPTSIGAICARSNIIESNFDPVCSRTNVCKRLRNGHRRRISCTRFSFAAAIAGDGSTVINVSAMFIDVHQQLIARNAHVPDIAKKKAA